MCDNYIVNDVIKQVTELQDQETKELASSMVESAVLFEDSLDFKHYFDFILKMQKILLTNGIFLREVIDVLEETDYEEYN